jgi:hypothetical protein
MSARMILIIVDIALLQLTYLTSFKIILMHPIKS